VTISENVATEQPTSSTSSLSTLTAQCRINSDPLYVRMPDF
jgi:hypothetical protein